MDTKQYKIDSKRKINLKEFSTKADKSLDKADVKDKLMPKNLERMAQLQEKLYAENQHSLLIVLQAMDAAGKDGAIRHVMTGLNPQGTQVVSFKTPSSQENDHGYLWRINKALPPRGEIGIFNRSHYEDVLIARVHDLVRTSQIPPELVTQDIWDLRYRQIRDFETYLAENGTTVIKIFLHVSKDEQRQRLLDRINEPDKNWKFSAGDIQERKFWDQYMQAYEQMLEHTSQQDAPWFVVPADNKWFARFLISQIVLETLEKIDPRIPELAEEERAKLEECRRLLEDEA
ncbi:MAG: polyphosphate kinase 2 family protein [Clostridiales bacterium]|jgi:PPK2 family polyphosphate:nucleotide phosphotransferase|nr:polyphosphate kinase 2 family protein [Clostridiales bacterium]